MFKITPINWLEIKSSLSVKNPKVEYKISKKLNEDFAFHGTFTVSIC